MLLLFLLAIAQGPVVRPRPDHDLAAYLEVVNRYRSGERVQALQEIRDWRSVEIDAALPGLRRRDYRLIEAAVLLHAEVGLLGLQPSSIVDARWHLLTSREIYERFVNLRGRIDPRDYYLAIATTSLLFGDAPTAWQFAGWARDVAPGDAETQLVLACTAESLADERAFRDDESGGDRLRREAESALRKVLTLDPGQAEALLRLGHVLLAEGRLAEAESLLILADARAGDDRGRYLARLFLGRAAKGSGRPGEAVGFYRRAVEAWPEAQAARLALALLLEREGGPTPARQPVAAMLAASRRDDRPADPWWTYPFGPPGFAKVALDRLWKALEP